MQLGVIRGADFNNDGAVNGLDLAQWKSAFGSSGSATHAQGDADGDLNVNGADLLAWQRQVGTPAAAVAGLPVPEPSALALAAAAPGLGIARRRILATRPQPLAA